VVNYDLPWNPMNVEQRIGRIVCIGQKHDVLRVINLAYKETVEGDVYFRLGERINLFQGIVGKLQPHPFAVAQQVRTTGVGAIGEPQRRTPTVPG
jgi:hypothetical protein